MFETGSERIYTFCAPLTALHALVTMAVRTTGAGLARAPLTSRQGG